MKSIYDLTPAQLVTPAPIHSKGKDILSGYHRVTKIHWSAASSNCWNFWSSQKELWPGYPSKIRANLAFLVSVLMTVKEQ